MRSKAFKGSCVALVLSLFVACEGQPQRQRDLCNSLAKCTNIYHGGCTGRLQAAIDDHRLSLAGLARCTDCVQGNELKDQCGDILGSRDCDKACEEVQIVLNARTSEASRTNACNALHDRCGEILEGPNRCQVSLAGELERDETFAADIEIGACINCLEPFSQGAIRIDTNTQSFEEFGILDAGSDAGGLIELFLCSTMIERCSESCTGVGVIEGRFEVATAMLGICRRGVKACIESETLEADAGAEEADAGADASDAGLPAIEPVPLDACYAALVDKSAALVRSCANCEAANATCDDLFLNCAECKTLYTTVADQ